MQMNILEELYFGSINPYAKCFDRHSEYAKLIKTISDSEEKLTSFLNALPEMKDQSHLFSQLMNAQGEVLAFCKQNSFIEGFQLGARFILDIFLIPQKSVIRDIRSSF
jgi:hypothetical protein